MCVEPYFETATHEGITHGIPFEYGSDEHYCGREHSSEANTHLVENDAGEDKEEGKHIEKNLGSLHGAKGC